MLTQNLPPVLRLPNELATRATAVVGLVYLSVVGRARLSVPIQRPCSNVPMAPRPTWWHQLQSSKREALLAVDLFNRSGDERQLEAFIVHMSMAWLRLIQAYTEKTGGDLFVRKSNGHRIRHTDGGWTYKSLAALLGEQFTEKDPRRVNIAFFIALRNRVEHRFERDIAGLVAGRTQAYILNYEETVAAWFGTEEGLADQLRFPLFLSSITTDAVSALKAMRKRVPVGVLEWLQDFDSGVDQAVRDDNHFDFRVYLMAQTGPKSQADAAMTFVSPDDLDDEQRKVMMQMQTIIQMKKVPVEDLRRLLPSEVAEEISKSLSKPFPMQMHTNAWHHYKVRPETNSPAPEKTRSDFCLYNGTFKQYVYTEAWVTFLLRKLSDEAEYKTVRTWHKKS